MGRITIESAALDRREPPRAGFFRAIGLAGISRGRSPCRNNPGSAPAPRGHSAVLAHHEMPHRKIPDRIAVRTFRPPLCPAPQSGLWGRTRSLLRAVRPRALDGPRRQAGSGRLRRPGVPVRLGADAPQGSASRSAPGKSLRRFSGSPVPPGRAGRGRAVRLRPEFKVAPLLEFRLGALRPLRPGVARPIWCAKIGRGTNARSQQARIFPARIRRRRG